MQTNPAPSSELQQLYSKLHAVAEAITYIEKRGRNTHQNYDYVQAEDVVRTIRDEMLKHKLIVLPGASSAEHLPYTASRGGAAFLTTVQLTYSFIDTETGVHVEIPWIGVGADTGGDKGVYKAFTGGLKYALKTAFLVPTTDDPERDTVTTQAPQASAPQGQHKDDGRPVAPLIPRDRAASILSKAVNAKMASLDLNASPGTPPEFHPAFKAVLALQNVTKIGELNVDQVEAVEKWLDSEVEA